MSTPTSRLGRAAGPFALALVLSGCGGMPSQGHAFQLPSVAQVSASLLSPSDVPPGFVAVPEMPPSRAFCGHSMWATPRISESRAFFREQGTASAGIKTAITALPDQGTARSAIASLRSFLATSCRRDVLPRDVLSLTLMQSPSFGMPAIGVHESAQLTGSNATGVPANFRIIYDLYVVADGRSVVEVELSGVKPDPRLLERVTRRQLERVDASGWSEARG